MQEIKELSSYRTTLKEKIQQMSMQLFTSRGIKAVKMDDIAAALGISKRTLYEIYDDKESLLRAGVSKYMEEHRQRMDYIVRNSSSVVEMILKFYKTHLEESSHVSPLFFSDLEKYPSILSTLHRNQEEKLKFYMGFMKRGVEEGYFREDINYKLISHMFDALGKYMMENHLYEAYTFKELYYNMLFVSIRGFCTDKGVKYIDNTILEDE